MKYERRNSDKYEKHKKITILLLILASLFLIACGKDEKKMIQKIKQEIK